jgi:hypothetical protein
MRPNHAALVHECDVDADEGMVEEDGGAVDVTSLQPKKPGVLQEVLAAMEVGKLDVVVIVGAGETEDEVDDVLDDEEVVVLSLQPNQPGVSQVVEAVVLDEVVALVVDMDDVVDTADVVDIDEVVVSSRHPNHPGVKHVSVLVRVLEVSVAVVLVLLVVGSVPLLSKKFQA